MAISFKIIMLATLIVLSVLAGGCFMLIDSPPPSDEWYNKGLSAKNDKEAFSWFSKAAEAGYPPARRKLAKMYEEGEYVQQNYAEAIKYYAEPAYFDDLYSQLHLGLCYIESNEDNIRAFAWLTIAAVKGDDMARKKSDEIVLQMSPDQINEANELIKGIRVLIYLKCRNFSYGICPSF